MIIIIPFLTFQVKKGCGGPTGIEPATSSTQRKNHTARPKTQVIVLLKSVSYFIKDN